MLAPAGAGGGAARPCGRLPDRGLEVGPTFVTDVS